MAKFERGHKKVGGRKKGSKASHTLEAEKVREYLIQQIIKEKEPLIKALLEKGKKGDVQALREIFDRALGRVAETIKFEEKLVIDLSKNGRSNKKD